MNGREILDAFVDQLRAQFASIEAASEGTEIALLAFAFVPDMPLEVSFVAPESSDMPPAELVRSYVRMLHTVLEGSDPERMEISQLDCAEGP